MQSLHPIIPTPIHYVQYEYYEYMQQCPLIILILVNVHVYSIIVLFQYVTLLYIYSILLCSTWHKHYLQYM